MTTDEKYMKRALQLAELGFGKVSPNPMVGCVIVHEDEGKVLGEGWHDVYGGPHAERNAVADVANKALIKESTVYVTLEPCVHFGKTPPCTDLLLDWMPRRVVVCNADPNPLVAGKGLEKLKKAGIKVQTGVLEEEGRWLNRRFFTFMEQKRPYIVLKWAQTQDGFIARSNFSSKWISNEQSRDMVHTWRAQEAGIMVGTNTVMYDNPRLNVRNGSGMDPVRIIIDRELKLSLGFNVFDNNQVTLCYNSLKDEADEYTQYIRLDFQKSLLPQLLEDVYKRKILSVLVEGGSTLLQSFIDEGYWDEARVFTGVQSFGEGVAAPQLNEKPVVRKHVNGDQLNIFENKNNKR